MKTHACAFAAALLAAAFLGAACAASRPATPSAPAERELTLLTWNLLHGVDEAGKANLEAKADWIRAQSPDVVFLQEQDRGVRRTQGVDQVALLAQRTGLRGAFGAFMDYQGGEYGLGMLTALSAGEARPLRLPDGDEPRVALLWEVDVLGERLLCVDVHFNWIADDVARFAQARALLAHLATIELACVVAGDFNDRPESRTLQAFLSAGFRHADPAGATWNARAPSKDIDHVLVRSGRGLGLEPLGGEILDGEQLSDHRAVRVRVRATRRD